MMSEKKAADNMKSGESPKDQVAAYVKKKYGVTAEHPWAKYPEYATFKAGENEKWFAILMHVSGKVLGYKDDRASNGCVDFIAGNDGMVWVINVKAEPEFIMMASGMRGFLPAYHMNKQHWVTILLDGSVPMEQVKGCIDRSFCMVTDTPAKRIYEAVKQIPKGKVATYGQVAELAGDKKMARAVGNALHRNPDPEGIPCYRVVNAKGELAGAFAFGGAGVQARLLRADGIEVVEDKVDLARYGIRLADGKIQTV